MKDMDKAVRRIRLALERGERMAVFGDYDVDGITSTVLLVHYLRSQGADCIKHIPRRIEDGYGLGRDALRALRDQGVTLVVTVDCGITGVEEARFAREIGLDLVITGGGGRGGPPPERLPLPLQAPGRGGRGPQAGPGPGGAPGGGPLPALQRPGRHRHGGGRDAHDRGEPHHRQPGAGGGGGDPVSGPPGPPAGDGPAGDGPDLHPDRLRPGPPDQRRRAHGGGGAGGGPPPHKRPRPGRGHGPGDVRPQPGAAGRGAGDLRPGRRADRGPPWSSPARSGIRGWWASWPAASARDTPAPAS